MIARWVVLGSIVVVMQGCAITFESQDGSRNTVGLLWEKSIPAAYPDVDYRRFRTLGLTLDTTDYTGGVVIGFKDWTVLALSGETDVSICTH